MDYFDYNLSRAGLEEKKPDIEMLEFTGDEVIEVDEDHSVTVDDVRRYIQSLRADEEGDEEGDEGAEEDADPPSDKVVSIRVA